MSISTSKKRQPNKSRTRTPRNSEMEFLEETSTNPEISQKRFENFSDENIDMSKLAKIEHNQFYNYNVMKLRKKPEETSREIRKLL